MVRRRLLVAVVLGTFVIVSWAITTIDRARFDSSVRSDTRALEVIDTTGSDHSSAASTATDVQRTVFPYSVIPGGVNSVDELRSAIAADAIVADHYKTFDLSKARVERLAAPRFAHVSFRIGERVYWTRNPLVLPAGERVITDGTNIARTRCGNQVATQPGPTSPAEPSEIVLDTPAATAPLTSRPLLIPVATPPSASQLAIPTAAILLPLIVDAPATRWDHGPNVQGTSAYDPPIVTSDGSSTAPTLNPDVPTVVPEPSSMMLVLTAAGGFVIRRFAGKRLGNHPVDRAPAVAVRTYTPHSPPRRL